MSHNIEKADRGIDASVFVVRVAPWHGLGKIFKKNPTVVQALKAMNGEYDMVKEPAERKGIVVPGHYWVVRTDTDQVLGEVGDKYHIISNADGFDILEAIGGKVLIETGAILGIGEKAFISCKLPTTTKIGDDLIEHYFVILLSHDGTTSVLLMITPIRPVCQNTVNLGIAKAVRKYSIRHTVNYEQKLEEAAKVLGIVKGYYTKFEDIANELLAKKRTERQFTALVDKLFKKPEDTASERAKFNFEKARELCIAALNVPDLADIRDTGWGHYNAIVDYADHARGTRIKDEQLNRENKFLRTFMDTDLKDEAARLILAAK